MTFLAILIALLLGAGLTIQSGINASLRSHLGHPLHATVINFVIGLVAVLLYATVAGIGRPPTALLQRTPLWMLTGGLIGGAYVVGTVILAPRLGAAVLVSLLVTGQLTTALIVDHFGLLGFPQQPVTLARALGGALLIGGVVLMRKGSGRGG